MNVIRFAQQAASMRGWAMQADAAGNLRLEVPTQAGRTQVVQVVMGVDGDGDRVAFVWSRAGDTRMLRDPTRLLQLNAQLSYGKVALQGSDVVIVHGILDSSADLPSVGKAIYWVARSADELEWQTYGAHTDTL